MDIKAIKLTKKHKQSWEELYHAYADFYGMPMNKQTLDTVWSWIFDDGNPFFALVVQNKSGKLLGFAHCRSMPSPLRGSIIGFLDDLYVLPEHRNSGCVQALYQELKKLGKQQNWAFIRWITAETNYKARASYDKIANKTHWLTYQMDVK